MANDSTELSPKDKQELLAKLARFSDGSIAQLFVANGLGQAYARPGRGSSKASRIAAAMTEAERRGLDESLFVAIGTMVASRKRATPRDDPDLPAAQEIEEAPKPSQPLADDRVRLPTSTPASRGNEGGPSPAVIPTRAGRLRLLFAGSAALAGIAVVLGVFYSSPSRAWEVRAIWLICGATIATVGALVYTQTLGHRGSAIWRTISRTVVPGAYLMSLGIICDVFLFRGTGLPETVAGIAIWLGLLWGTVGPVLVHKAIVEGLKGELAGTPRASPDTHAPVLAEQRLTRGEIYVIAAAVFQGVATLAAALYS